MAISGLTYTLSAIIASPSCYVGAIIKSSDDVKYEKQELSYRKQIARKLGSQYVEGIHRPKYYIVTLKSRLKVTQGH